ncbi:MAG: ABC transporter ATP-binding protein [Bacteroidota bacterium]
MDSVICTENLSKHYHKLKAVDKVSISVRKGEIYGFLGLNGAGKTTTIRMLLGLIGPTSGTAHLNNNKVNPGNPEMWRNVGYLVEVPYSYPDLTVWENLEIIRRLRLIKDAKSTLRIIEKLKLGQYRNVLSKNLSLGNAQRLGLAKALIHEPDILLLDEPANGLDPEGIVEIRELLVNQAVNKGITIFISSHILGEISKLATRIGIIHEGKMVHESSVSEMVTLRKHCLQVKANDLASASEILTRHGYKISAEDEGVLEITGKEAVSNPDRVATLMVSSGCPPTLLNVEEEDLETFFLRIIKAKGGTR